MPFLIINSTNQLITSIKPIIAYTQSIQAQLVGPLAWLVSSWRCPEYVCMFYDFLATARYSSTKRRQAEDNRYANSNRVFPDEAWKLGQSKVRVRVYCVLRQRYVVARCSARAFYRLMDALLSTVESLFSGFRLFSSFPHIATSYFWRPQRGILAIGHRYQTIYVTIFPPSQSEHRRVLTDLWIVRALRHVLIVDAASQHFFAIRFGYTVNLSHQIIRY